MGLSCGSSTFRDFEQAARSSIAARPSKKMRLLETNWRSEKRGAPIDWLLINNLEAIFLNHGIGEDFFGDMLQLILRFVATPAIDVQNEEFALANVGDLRVAQAREGVLNGLSLRIKHRALRHHPHMSFHNLSITLPGAGSRRRPPTGPSLIQCLLLRPENAKAKPFATTRTNSASLSPISRAV